MLNKVILMGRFAADPVLRHTKSGTPVATFRLAVDRDFKDKDGSRQTDWLDCVAWKGTAEFISRYFSKGRLVVVEGALQTRSWTDKDGNKRVSVETIVSSAWFADSKKEPASVYKDPADAYDENYMPPPVGRPTGSEPPAGQEYMECFSSDEELPF